MSIFSAAASLHKKDIFLCALIHLTMSVKTWIEKCLTSKSLLFQIKTHWLGFVFNDLFLFLFICILSDKTKELMIVERNSRRRFKTSRTGRRSRWLKEEEEERKSMGRSSLWIFLLSLSLSHQSVTAQAEGTVKQKGTLTYYAHISITSIFTASMFTTLACHLFKISDCDSFSCHFSLCVFRLFPLDEKC